MAADARLDGKRSASNRRQVIFVLGAYQSPPDNLTIYIDVWLPLLRHEIATLDVNTTDSAGTLLELFGQAKNDYHCEYT